MELTILMPCLNEAETLAVCIKKAQASLLDLGIDGEVLIADNGSTDGSQAIAEHHGARVVDIDQRGYGAALIGGISAARGRYVIMGDADDSYAFDAIQPFVVALRSGSQLVMGNRFRGGIKPGAMPFLHKYLGNPVLSFLGRMLFRIPVGDFHCGLRGFDRASILALHLTTPGMEFASEMVIKASLFGLKITEVPTVLSPDGRTRSPHLRTWRDGWRHLRFMLLCSPTWLFAVPGVVALLVGATMVAILANRPIDVGSIQLSVQAMVFFAFMALVGVQIVAFGIAARSLARLMGVLPQDDGSRILREHFSLERGLVIAAILMVLGAVIAGSSVGTWAGAGFGAVKLGDALRVSVPGLTILAIGVQVLFTSFFLGVAGLGRR